MTRLLCLVLVSLLAANSQALTKAYRTVPTRVLSDTEAFGGCMVKLAAPPVEAGLDCKGSWVSFSCTGEFASRDAANRNFEMAQIALLTGREVVVRVDDTKKHDDFCFASRIVIFGE